MLSFAFDAVSAAFTFCHTVVDVGAPCVCHGSFYLSTQDEKSAMMSRSFPRMPRVCTQMSHMPWLTFLRSRVLAKTS